MGEWPRALKGKELLQTKIVVSKIVSCRDFWSLCHQDVMVKLLS